MYFFFRHSQGDVVHPYKHRLGAVLAALVPKRIESIGARTKPGVPWISPEFFVVLLI
jgi:hypothetical protein